MNSPAGCTKCMISKLINPIISYYIIGLSRDIKGHWAKIIDQSRHYLNFGHEMKKIKFNEDQYIKTHKKWLSNALPALSIEVISTAWRAISTFKW